MNSPPNRSRPRQLGSALRMFATWATATTKTRSKNSSIHVARRSPSSTSIVRSRGGWTISRPAVVTTRGAVSAESAHGRPRHWRACAKSSLALELRLPFLSERGQPLARVLGRERQIEQAPLVLEPQLERPLVRPVDGLLGEARRDGSLRGDVARHPLCLLQPRFARDHARDEAGRE